MINILPRTMEKADLQKALKTIADTAISIDQVNISMREIEKNKKEGNYSATELTIVDALIELVNNLKRG